MTRRAAGRSRRARFRPSAAAAILAAGVLLLSGCSTGSDAVAQGGSFEFVSPGGQTEIFYDPPSSRGTIGDISGASLMEDGATVGVDDYAGEVVVLNVWGQWCGPCRAEVPALESVFEATRDQGVQFLGIDVRDYNKGKAQHFFRTYDVSYPSIYDPPMRTLGALGNFPANVVPSTLVLDREHRVAAVFLKALTEEELQPVVERIAAEPQEAP
ncbi:TlpA family protein disulfide reductase [Tomitella fengzijianii]|uniref:TlpA family protein disulfide reductase n=1 Tax=Tomitella fengzijianii TaxID=2597660 RepID=A0A516X1M1_9ACTN|nr:TlpA disulfide reductase family protein [Tomitella fengzijianii]QDQ96511.1 TlpA family protein disulfide reductase [Tomitella fengzijianii]